MTTVLIIGLILYVAFWIWLFKTAQKVPDNFTNS